MNRQVSIGAGLETNSGDDKDEEGKTFTVGFTAFLNPGFSVHAGFNKFPADNSSVADEDAWEIEMTARF